MAKQKFKIGENNARIIKNGKRIEVVITLAFEDKGKWMYEVAYDTNHGREYDIVAEDKISPIFVMPMLKMKMNPSPVYLKMR